MMEEPITYMNTKDTCILCFKKPEDGFELIEHHVKYFPQIVAFVHYDCHQKIHDPENPIKHLIQYEDGDSRKFYEGKKIVEVHCSECGAIEPKHYRLCRLFKGGKK